MLFAGGQNIAEAQEYRNFVVGKISFEISEIIRVLQYTTYEEEGGDDPLNDMKKAASLFDSNMGPAMKWVSTPTESAGGLGKSGVGHWVNCLLVGGVEHWVKVWPYSGLRGQQPECVVTMVSISTVKLSILIHFICNFPLVKKFHLLFHLLPIRERILFF